MPDNLNERAREVLRTNDRGGYTVPTRGLYPYQWNWDSALVALGFATFDESRACRELETLFEGQWDDGFLPHIIFRRDDPDYFPGPSVWQAGGRLPTSGITQPPVAGTVIRKLLTTVSDQTVKARLEALFPAVIDWHRWFHRYRVPADSNAVIITHPWESGRDNCVEWDAPESAIDVSGVGEYERRDLKHADAAMRPTKTDYDRYIALIDYGRGCNWDHGQIADKGPFRVADIGMTTILLRANRDLLALAGELGYGEVEDELNDYIAQLERGMDWLWDDKLGAFCSRDVITGKHSGVLTSASFLAYYANAGNVQQRARLEEHWERIARAVRYTVPSHDPQEARFDDLRYWRGPVWTIVNYMVARGFAENGLVEQAARVRDDSAALIRQEGFAEAYSPTSGKPSGGEEFSWTAAMWLAWCGRSVT